MNLQAYLRDHAEQPGGLLSRSSDILLAGLLVAIIALMILPLPRLMIDVLVALNIAIGLMLVLMGIYIGSALQFSSFPSVLLISTLFRLALSVATTRMILLHGDAGHIIDTFGRMVAGGNLVVGLVVFLIITLVQFLVIAKGAERVAEVGARFTLDAMPGKQLSIDSDLRSGLIDKIEARDKRRELELESKLHGSMDGAMKFVKGDAIAGIVIIVVNLLGGLAIGVFQLGMDAGAAMQKYSILTIGDGLVAQIPALLGAMSAGLIVTRATDNRTNQHLGESIKGQFAAIPRVMLVAGGICLLLSLVPGFPTGVFIVLGLLLAASGAVLVPALRSRFEGLSSAPSFDAVMDTKAARRKRVDPAQAGPVQQAIPLLLELPPVFGVAGRQESLRDAITASVDSYQLRSGVAMPEVRIHFRSDSDQTWALHAFEVPITSGKVSAETSVDQLAANVELALRRHGTLFLGLQETGQLMSIASVTYPDIVKEALRAVPMPNIATILRNLVEEEVSIRNLRGILEGLLHAASHEKDLYNLTEFARMSLARQISHQVAPEGDLRAVGLTPALEEFLTQQLRSAGGVTQLSVDPDTVVELRRRFVEAVAEHRPAALITHVQLRRHVRQLVAAQLFDTPVLSYNELVPSLTLDMVHMVQPVDAVPLASVK